MTPSQTSRTQTHAPTLCSTHLGVTPLRCSLSQLPLMLTGFPCCLCAPTGCPPGFGANPNGAPLCSPCQPGFYRPGGNSIQPCWRCRGSAFLTSPPGASSLVQCVCRPGVSPWHGPRGGGLTHSVQAGSVCALGSWARGAAGLRLIHRHRHKNTLIVNTEY